MPGLDQTGPAGYGAGMGRGRGPCGQGMALGRGMAQRCGRGFGRGRGFCWKSFPEPGPVSREAQKQLLETELKRIGAEKTEIEKRLTTLE